MIDVDHPLVSPQVWHILTRHLLVSKELELKWWKALWKRDDSCCVQIRSGLLLADAAPSVTGAWLLVDPVTLLDKHLAPDRTVPCVERLVKLGDLARSEGSLIQEAILLKTTAGGQWRLSHRETTHAL